MSTENQIEAAHGEKMIELKVRFWTDGIAPDKGKLIPKRALTSGVVRLTPNDAHGIAKNNKPIPFNSLMQLPAAIEKILLREGIVLHLSSNDKLIKPRGK